MKTWQDFIKLTDEKQRQQFLITLVNDWKSGDLYTNAVEAWQYVDEENAAINARNFFYATKVKNADGTTSDVVRKSRFRANNKVANGMFGKLITQKTQYLLGDGIAIDDEQKKKLGDEIDQKTQDAGISASIASVAWGYGYLKDGAFDVEIFLGEELIPLIDENTGETMAAVRFYELAEKRITFYELYELDGVTKYRTGGQTGKGLEVLAPKTTYITRQLRFPNNQTVTVGSANLGELPLIAFKNTKRGKSDFKKGLKTKLDLYDIILSDFGNNLEDAKDVYWVLQNYTGQDIDQFLEELNAFKSIKVGQDGDAKAVTTEIPYAARDTALKILERRIIADYMGLDMDAIKGSSLTNVAILAAYTELGFKVSEFEWGALRFVRGIIRLMQKLTGDTEDITVNDFNRRTIINDSEIIANLNASPYLSEKTKIERNPYSAPDELERIAAEGRRIIPDDDGEGDNE